MKLIMENWRKFILEVQDDHFDEQTGAPISEEGMEICASRKGCFIKHLMAGIYFESSSPSEYQNLVDIAKSSAQKEGWFSDGSGPWDYEWENGQRLGRISQAGSEEEGEMIDPDQNNDGHVSPDALRRIADKVEASADEPSGAPRSKISKLSQLDSELDDISDEEAFDRMMKIKGKQK